MNEVVEQLVSVQDKDMRIFKLEQMIVGIPAEKAKIEQDMQGAEKLVEEAKSNHQHVQISIKDLQSDVEGIQARILQLQMKSTETKKNDEFRSILAQIEKLKEDIIEKEDKELELMETLEVSKEKLAEAENEKKASDARIKAAQDDLDVKQKNCQEQVEKIRSERAEVASCIENKDLLNRYERLIKKKLSAGIMRKGIAKIEKGQCGYCHLTITADAQIKAKKGYINCPTCGTILYAT